MGLLTNGVGLLVLVTGAGHYHSNLKRLRICAARVPPLLLVVKYRWTYTRRVAISPIAGNLTPV